MKTYSLSKKFVLTGIVSLVTIFLSDIVIQMLFPVPGEGYGVWAEYPKSKLLLVSQPDHFQFIHRYNKYGFRGTDFPIEPQSAIRIVAVGDSFTEGVGAEEQESWPSVLAKLLSEKRWEVINLGDAGSQLDRYAQIIANVAIPLKPTDIVVAVNSGDLRYGVDLPADLSIRTEFGNPFKDQRKFFMKPFVTLLPGWSYLQDRVRGRWPQQKGLYWRSYNEDMKESAVHELAMRQNISPLKARRLVEQHESMIAPHVLDASRKGLYNPGAIRLELIEPYILYHHKSCDLHDDEDDLKESTYTWIKWYAETCKQYSIRGWLLYFPVPPLVCEGPWGTFADSYYEDAPDILGDTSIARLFESTCADCSIRYIDASAVLCEHNEEKLYHRWDTHPTARAYELVGDLVAHSMTAIDSMTF